MYRLASVLVLLCCLARPVSAQDWSVVPLGITDTLRAFEQGSSGDVFLIGDNGTVRMAFSPFTDWSLVNVGTNADLLSLVRQTATQIWITGRNGVVRVRDNQLEWNVRNIPDATQDYIVFSRSSGEAIAAGSGGSIWKSEDLGVTWSLQNSGTTTPLHAGIGGTFAEGYVVGDGGLILKSTDVGETWTPLPSGTIAALYDVQFIPGGVEVAGANGTLLSSNDGGTTWTPRPSNTTATLRALSTSGQNANFHLAAGDGGTVLRSLDNGLTWCLMDPGVTTDFYAARMFDNNLYIAAGADGVLMQTETGLSDGCQFVSNESEAAAPGHALSAVWPNPARSEATLTFRVDQPQHVMVKVFDVQGRRVGEAFTDRAAAGVIVPVALDVQGLAAGTYIVRVQGADFTDHRRMAVIR